MMSYKTQFGNLIQRYSSPKISIKTQVPTLGISKKISTWLQFFTTLGCRFGHLMGIDLWTGNQIGVLLILHITIDFWPSA